MALSTSVEAATGRVPITIVALNGSSTRPISSSSPTMSGRSMTVAPGTCCSTRPTPRHARARRARSIVRIFHGQAPLDPETGWGALHEPRARRRRGRSPGGCAAGRAAAAVERVLKRTGLDRLFRIHPDRATAIQAF